MKKNYKFYRQLDHMDCGPTSLKMIAAYHGKDYSLDFLRANTFITRQGVSLLGISEAAEKIGFKTLMVKITSRQLLEQAPLPCILHWNQEHFVVLYAIEKRRNWWGKSQPLKYIIADPGHDLVSVDEQTFRNCWMQQSERGVALLMEPTPDFYNKQEDNKKPSKGFKFLFQYLRPYKGYLFQILLGMGLSSVISLIFPFLTQSLVDHGINRHNVDFIHLILLSQLLLFLGSIGVDMIRNWILLHVSTRVSVTIISNFLIKLMKLPINYFESKNVGDIAQRIRDHDRIEDFLTGTTLSTFFSLINLVIFSIVLGYFSPVLLAIFAGGSALSVGWILIFLKQRKDLDYGRFQQLRETQNSIFELITGMQEVKLNNCEKTRLWTWERIQAKLFKINIKSMALEQYQESGSIFFTQLKNIIISYLAAVLVIHNDITLGVMLSISYIVGQMNGPLSQLMMFIRKVQDAKISMARLSEIHDRDDEELNEETVMSNAFTSKGTTDTMGMASHLVVSSGQQDGIVLQNASFRYGGPNSQLVLKNLNLLIPKNKVTAIVGTSGSGKTTLLKLLLKFYPLAEGEISVDGQNLEKLSAKAWRGKCGTVMQDGFLFSDTIAKNIAVEGDNIDEKRLVQAIETANLQDYIKRLPLGLLHKIGNSGSGLSGGQRQRIFISRAVYKDPEYIFFDEATSALDANNEKVILENMDAFFKNRTVVVIAHRLSTVKNADQIVVLDRGEIIEVGTHAELTSRKGAYYNLVKNQLELAA